MANASKGIRTSFSWPELRVIQCNRHVNEQGELSGEPTAVNHPIQVSGEDDEQSPVVPQVDTERQRLNDSRLLQQKLPSVAQGSPILNWYKDIQCRFSCVVLSLSFLCKLQGKRLCPMALVKGATNSRKIAECTNKMCADTISLECENALMLFGDAELITEAAGKANITCLEDLNKALVDVTDDNISGGCGLLVFKYRGCEMKHAVAFWKDEDKINIFDPQSGQWWLDSEENPKGIEAVQCYKADFDRLSLLQPARCLYRGSQGHTPLQM